MATIITKNSSTAAAVPTAGQLVQGELAVNVTDKKVYTKDASSAVVKLVGSLGNQESNNVAITGGTITGTTVSGSANINVQRFSGDGTTTVFTLSSSPVSENNTQIYINGVYQQKDTYNVVGTTLTFSEAPVADTDNIEVVTTSMQAIGTTTSDLVSYTPAGTGAVATNVQTKLRESVSVKDFGAVGGSDESAKFQLAVDSISVSGNILIPAGNYSLTTASSINVGTKAINWVVSQDATPPSGLPGVVVYGGSFSLPESSSQANRDVRVQYMEDVGNTLATPSLRQYVHHVKAFMPDNGMISGEMEFRGYSFDIGTDQTYNQADIRGIKGRVYADSGNSNLRSIYGVADGSGTHTGDLTGVIGTVLRSGTSTGNAVAVRGHMSGTLTSGGCAAFQAAGNGGTAAPSFGYSIRTGTNALLPNIACYQAHGGGTGAMFMGYKSDSDTTIVYEVNNKGIVKTPAVNSGRVTISDDGVAVITPPATSGFFEIFQEETNGTYGKVFFRVTASPLGLSCFSGALFSVTNTVLTGTTGTDGRLTIGCANDGKIYIENRQGASRNCIYLFTCQSN